MNTGETDLMGCNPANWKCGFIYFCREDPRIVVPKRWRGLGWTLNFARPLALPFLAGVILFLFGPFYLLSSLGITFQHGTDWMLIIAEIVIVSLVCTRMASPRRRSEGADE